MFSNQRRGSSGLGSIIGVALVLAGFLGSAGLLAKVYRDGGVLQGAAGCELVCNQAGSTVVKG
jgi:hypothetical protein